MKKFIYILIESAVLVAILRVFIQLLFGDVFKDGNFLILVIIPMLLIMALMYIISSMLHK